MCLFFILKAKLNDYAETHGAANSQTSGRDWVTHVIGMCDASYKDFWTSHFPNVPENMKLVELRDAYPTELVYKKVVEILSPNEETKMVALKQFKEWEILLQGWWLNRSTNAEPEHNRNISLQILNEFLTSHFIEQPDVYPIQEAAQDVSPAEAFASYYFYVV